MQKAKGLVMVLICFFSFLKTNATVKDSVKNHSFPYLQSALKGDTSNASNLVNGFFQLPDSLNPQSVYHYFSYDSLHLTKVEITHNIFSKTKNIVTEIPQLRPTSPEKWLFYFILFLAGIVVFVKSAFTRYFNELWRSFFNMNNAMLMMRQQDIAFSVPGLLLSVNFYVVIAIYIFLKIHQLKIHIPINDIGLIGVLVLFIMAFIMFRFFIYRASMMMFNKKTELESISFIDLMQLEFSGIIMVPMVLVLAFGSSTITDYLWIASYILTATILGYRLILGWRIGGRLIFQNWFHFILYICSVEIAPILIILKSVQYAIVLN
ncbi:MAG: hypothetical protein RL065_1533 [Bacteroidota bacterium]|jgi:hypothetical protein